MNKSRLGAFTDVVITIPATIMVLPPKTVSLQGQTEDWPTFVAYSLFFGASTWCGFRTIMFSIRRKAARREHLCSMVCDFSWSASNSCHCRGDRTS